VIALQNPERSVVQTCGLASSERKWRKFCSLAIVKKGWWKWFGGLFCPVVGNL